MKLIKLKLKSWLWQLIFQDESHFEARYVEAKKAELEMFDK